MVTLCKWYDDQCEESAAAHQPTFSSTMSASATVSFSYPVDSSVVDFNPFESRALVIGSLSTAQDGQYQALISSLDESLNVERQMVDRLLDGGT